MRAAPPHYRLQCERQRGPHNPTRPPKVAHPLNSPMNNDTGQSNMVIAQLAYMTTCITTAVAQTKATLDASPRSTVSEMLTTRDRTTHQPSHLRREPCPCEWSDDEMSVETVPQVKLEHMINVEPSFVLYALLLDPGCCMRAHIILIELVEPEGKKRSPPPSWDPPPSCQYPPPHPPADPPKF